MKTILISGGTGMIGQALTRALAADGHHVIILTRKSSGSSHQPHVSYATWDPYNNTIERAAIEKADAIIHLAGANVGKGRWTRSRKKEILESRVKSGQLLAHALTTIPNHVEVVISASAIGYYGPDPENNEEHAFTETDVPYDDFLSHVVKEWEAAIAPVMGLHKRLIILRTGIVLSREGGAYPEFKKPLKMGVAPVLGNGRQMVSWIHIDDLVNMYRFALENDMLRGVYNAVAPMPVTNSQLMKAIGTHHMMAVPFKVPSWLLRIVLGEMSIEVLKSATVSSKKIQEAGFVYQYPDISSAIGQLESKT